MAAQILQSVCRGPIDNIRSMCGMKAVLQFTPAVRVSANSQFPKTNQKGKCTFSGSLLALLQRLCWCKFTIHFRILISYILILFNFYDILNEVIASV